jgi:hypothetical protein
MIEKYSFGMIVIDGKTYDRDVKLLSTGVKPEWWRLEGHRLQLADMQDALDPKPKTIIVGMGHDGCMSVDDEVREYCKKNKIRLIELLTGDAVKKYNELAGKGVVGLFHLTC